MNRYMLILLLLFSTQLSACLEVDVVFPQSTRVTVVDGDPILAKSNLSFHTQLLQPFTYSGGLQEGDLASIRLHSFQVVVTDGSLTVGDVDDLDFVVSAEVFIGPSQPGSQLSRARLAWYNKGEFAQDDPMLIDFQINERLELLPYFQEGFELTTDSVVKVPTDPVSVQGHAVFVGKHELL